MRTWCRPHSMCTNRSRVAGWCALAALAMVSAVACQREPAASGPSGTSRMSPEAAVPVAVSADGGPGTAAGTPGSPDRSAIRFRDISESTGITFVHCSGNSPEKYYPAANGSGVAMLDYDADGWLDLYFVTTRNLPMSAPSQSHGNKLYRNRRNGTFEDVTERAGVAFRGFCHGVTVGDVNNDGFPDMYLTNLGPNVLYLNHGDGTFRDATRGSGLDGPAWSSAAALLDYDGDGRLDIYVSCYGRWSENEEHPYCGDRARGIRTFCAPPSIPPVRHYLFRNRGNGTFEDTTKAAGILRSDGRGMAVVAADVDGNGWPDLFVANDACPNFLFLNRGNGTFDDAGATAGAACSADGKNQSGMGVDIEDVDGDGLPELFVSHFRNEYATLYRNIGNATFDDVSASVGIVQGSTGEVGWGCALADFDNDGWPDMFVANGHVDDNLEKLGQKVSYAERSRLWRNVGAGRFQLVPDAGPFFAQEHVARGAAFGDLDNDGDIDIVISRMDARPIILSNESASGSWIRLHLMGRRSNRSAIGASVVVHAEGQAIHRHLKGGGSYLSANDPRLLIGLGSARGVDRVEIRWPSGQRSTLTSPAIGTTHRVAEPDGEPRRSRPPRNGDGPDIDPMPGP